MYYILKPSLHFNLALMRNGLFFCRISYYKSSHFRTREKVVVELFNPRSRIHLTVNESLTFYGVLKVSALNCSGFKLPKGKIPH